MLLVAFDAAAAALVIGIIMYDAWRVYELSPMLKSEYVPLMAGIVGCRGSQ